MNGLILLVDDSEISRAVIRRRLEDAGYRVNEAADGAEGAVAALRQVPDVLITDIEMPVMDGFQLSRLIKADPATAAVPVVILTSQTEATSRFWGLHAGADAFVTKDELETALVPIVHGLARDSRIDHSVQEESSMGPLQVLARVARHLDSGLMEATLINQVLQVGRSQEGLAEVARHMLELFSCIVHAHMISLCTLDNREMRVFLLRPNEGAVFVDEDRLITWALQYVQASPAGLAGARCEGDTGGAGRQLRPEEAVTVDLSLRGAKGFLAVWPQRPELFSGLPQELLVKAAPHASLVLDNVLLAGHLRRLSTFDGLTGLFNRRTIGERLSQELERARRHGMPLSVALCDIDRFKLVNDTHGHMVGDAVLCEVTTRLARGLRTSDLLGRWGGEEFLIIFPHSDLDSARTVAKRICSGLAEHELNPGGAGGLALRVTASFGLACNTEVSEAGAADSILALADRRLYEAKAAGRSCVRP